MSYRFSAPLIAGAYHFGFRGLGVLASTIPSSGTHGAGFGYASIEPDDTSAELRFEILERPAAGEFFAFEDTGFTYTGPSGSFTFRKWKDGVNDGTATATLTDEGQVTQLVSAEFSGSYAIAGLVSAEFSGSYAISALVSAEFSGAYAILVATPPTGGGISVSPSCTVNFDGGTNRVDF